MNEKASARQAVRVARRERASREGAAFREQLYALVRELGARRVSCFVGVGDEPDSEGFLEWARAEGVEVLLPRVVGDDALEWALLDDAPLVAGAFGIPEPAGATLGPDALAGVDLVLVPAAAVDRSGTRLGWGRGYFDRALAAIHPPHRPPVYAVVYESEVRDSLPAEPHDAPVDGAVTELAVHRFR